MILIFIGLLILIVFLVAIRILIKKIIKKRNQEKCNPKLDPVSVPHTTVTGTCMSSEPSDHRMHSDPSDHRMHSDPLDEGMYSEPIDYSTDKEASTCPDLKDYVHKSELVPNMTFRTNPYFVKKTCSKAECTKTKSDPCRKTTHYEYDWIPVLETECVV